MILGEHDLKQDPDGNRAKRLIQPIQDIIVHESYDKEYRGGASPNDIALIRVNKMITLFDDDPNISNVKPVCLPWNSNDPGQKIIPGAELIGLGWGRITNKKIANLRKFLLFRAGTGVLQQLIVPGISKRTCRSQVKNIELDSRFQLCAGGEEGKYIKFVKNQILVLL